MFVNRDRELEFLRTQFSTGERQLLVLYGRRRVGKTALVTAFLDREGHDHVYFLADQQGTNANATRFAHACADTFDDVPPAVEGFDAGFEYVVRRADGPIVVVIDEFSYLVGEDEAIPSVFQRINDEILASTDISVILLGSSISMMEEGALSHDSPLYGRRTGQWKLTPLSFADACAFVPGYAAEDLVRTYAILGGVPAYLQQFDPERSLAANIRERTLSKGTFLYEEPEFFLRQELREPGTYMAILEAMATGNTTVTEIANAIGRNASGISRYLANLERLAVVDRIVPVTEPYRKRGRYEIADGFFSFWFRFVVPNRADLEQGEARTVTDAVVNQLDEHASHTFETICRQAVRHPDFPVDTSRTGTWWYGEREIDVVALNEDDATLLLGECKWTNSPVGRGLLAQLEEDASNVRWRGAERRERYVLFSKSGFTDDLVELGSERGDLVLYDLDDLIDLLDVDSTGSP